MCGIAGLIGPTSADADVVTKMATAISHRGPDGCGSWVDPTVGIALAHRRLSIVDLSIGGAQPMVSADGRWVLVFNGEIYNFRALRQQLEATASIAWRGQCDTEVLLEAIAAWGVDVTLQRLNGMFAIAVWDRRNRTLVLARDRTGEKPLYFGRVGQDMVFASELRALRTHPAWRHAVEPRALAWMLEVGYVPAPWSIHPGIFKLPAGSLLRLRAPIDWSGEDLPLVSRIEKFWDLDAIVTQGRAAAAPVSASAALAKFRSLLDDSVRLRMVADVPVGVLLSGGIDSGLVAASMARQSRHKILTFTVGFDGSEVDESANAAATARHLGTDHTRMLLSPSSALELVGEMADVYDEPFADAAGLAAVLVCRTARGVVKVALTGDGGDELFHGYQRYLDAARLWPIAEHVPYSMRRWLCAGLSRAGDWLPASALARVAHRQGERLAAKDAIDYAAALMRFPAAGLASSRVEHRVDPAWPALPACLMAASIGEKLRFFDQAFALPEGIHTKLDRASMWVGLELRTPLLDPRLVAFSWQLPLHMQTKHGLGKHLMRRLAAEDLPPKTASRRKQGFDVPVAQWLRGPLRAWSASLLAPQALAGCPELNATAVQSMYAKHLSGQGDFGRALWAVLMYRLWSERYG